MKFSPLFFAPIRLAQQGVVNSLRFANFHTFPAWNANTSSVPQSGTTTSPMNTDTRAYKTQFSAPARPHTRCAFRSERTGVAYVIVMTEWPCIIAGATTEAFDVFTYGDVHCTILLLTSLSKSLRINDSLALAASSQWMMRAHVSVYVCVRVWDVWVQIREEAWSRWFIMLRQHSNTCNQLLVVSSWPIFYYILLLLVAMKLSFCSVYQLCFLVSDTYHICRHEKTNHIRYIFNTTLQWHGLLKSFQVDISVHVTWLCGISLFITRKVLWSCHSSGCLAPCKHSFGVHL